MIIDGNVASLLDLQDLRDGQPHLHTRQFYWTDGTWRKDCTLFVADIGPSYISSCFIPISSQRRQLFLDQTYSIVRQFFTIRPVIHDDGRFALDLGDEPTQISGHAVLIGGSPENNWYHWLLTWLPRLALCSALRPDLLEDPNVRFIFHPHAQKEPYLSTIYAFGLRPEQLVFVDPDRPVFIERLFIPTMTDQNFYFPEYHKLCWDVLSTKLPPEDGRRVLPKRFFVSREGQSSPKRRLLNLADLASLFERLDIAIVTPEELTGVEQIRLFLKAELVIGVHGAGLATILFCRPTCHVVILDCDRNIWIGMTGMFSSLAKVLAIDHTVLRVDEVIDANIDYSQFFNLHNRDVIVDVPSLTRALEHRISNVTPDLKLRRDDRTMANTEIGLDDYIAATTKSLSRLSPFQGVQPRGYDTNFLGVKTAFHLMAHWYPKDGVEHGMNHDRPTTTSLPHPTWGEPFFEYGSMIRAIDEGGDEIFIVELGGGYAARCADMAFMARVLGKTSTSLVVEPVPQYIEWARAHFSDNGLAAAKHHVLPAAVTANSRPIPMNTAYSGFGNEVTRVDSSIAHDSVVISDLLAGVPINVGGQVVEMVNGFALNDITALYKYVDLIDIDVQHLEFAILEPCWETVNAKVGRLHIGTHSVELHEKLKLALLRNDWAIEVDLHPYSSTECLDGPTKINDGILAAKNRRRSASSLIAR